MDREDDDAKYRAAPTMTVVHRFVPAGPMPPPTPPPAAGRYRPRRLHARGGVGEVFLATDEELQRDVALKSIQDAYAGDPDGQERFLREARITGRLQHPGIVPVYGLGRDASGRPCYAMRFIEGESLSESIRRHHGSIVAPDGSPPLNQRQLLLRFVAACNAVAYAHSRGVVHRDLKPLNIMLGRYGETLVVDWGLAKAADPEPASDGAGLHEPSLSEADTMVGAAAGTPSFMSPEQAAGQWDQVGPASDVFSLGATLYVLLTGQLPFPGESIEEVLDRVHIGTFEPPRGLKPDLDPALEAICLRAMAFHSADRYTSALALASDIERWLGDEPVQAYRDPWSRRLRRWARRHPAAVGATAAAALIVMLGLAAANFWLSARNLREQALREDAQRHELVAAGERDEAAKQRDEAARQRDQAAASFRMARDAVRQLLDDDGLARLRNLPQVEPVRLALLEKALGFHESFLRQAGNDPSVREDAAFARFEVADIHRELGRHAKAVSSYEAARDTFLTLRREYPKNADYPLALAKVHNNLSLAYLSTRRLEDAEREVRCSIDLTESLRRANPGSQLLLASLAKNYHNLGMAQRDLGRAADSEASYRKSLEVGAEVLKLTPTDIYHRLDQAKHHTNLASLLLSAKRYPEVGDHIGSAVGILEPLARENDSVSDIRRTLARACVIQGKFLAATNDAIGPAEAAFRKAIAQFERLARDFKHVPGHQTDLVDGCDHLASLLVSAKRTADAVDDFRRELAARVAELALEPGNVELAMGHAARICNRGVDLMDVKESEAALEFFAEAIRILTAVRGKDPNTRQSAVFLRNNLFNRAIAFERLSRLDEAIESMRSAMMLAANALDRADMELRIAFSLVRLSRHDEAAKTALAAAQTEKLAAKDALRAVYLLAQSAEGVARDESRPAAERDQTARERNAQALAILTRYRADPQLREPQTLKSLREDPVFEPLRKLPGFESLIAELGN